MNYKTQKGFTLIEMIAVLGIFAILTSVVIFNHTKFRSDTILTNMAYELALSIREAQIYGISARNAISGGAPDFSKAYGIYISTTNPSQYFLFADANSDSEYSGTDCLQSNGDVCATAYTLQRNIEVESIHVDCGNIKTEASILFKRPNPEPIVNTGDDEETFSKVQIALKAPDDARRYVVIANNGQISVENEPICSII